MCALLLTRQVLRQQSIKVYRIIRHDISLYEVLIDIILLEASVNIFHRICVDNLKNSVVFFIALLLL